MSGRREEVLSANTHTHRAEQGAHREEAGGDNMCQRAAARSMPIKGARGMRAYIKVPTLTNIAAAPARPPPVAFHAATLSVSPSGGLAFSAACGREGRTAASEICTRQRAQTHRLKVALWCDMAGLVLAESWSSKNKQKCCGRTDRWDDQGCLNRMQVLQAEHHG